MVCDPLFPLSPSVSPFIPPSHPSHSHSFYNTCFRPLSFSLSLFFLLILNFLFHFYSITLSLFLSPSLSSSFSLLPPHTYSLISPNLFLSLYPTADLEIPLSPTAVPLTMTSAWAHRWLWGDLYIFEGFLVYFLGLSSMYILMAIAVDRYIAISKPLLGAKITKKIAVISCREYFWLSCPVASFFFILSFLLSIIIFLLVLLLLARCYEVYLSFGVLLSRLSPRLISPSIVRTYSICTL